LDYQDSHFIKSDTANLLMPKTSQTYKQSGEYKIKNFI
jgi:hypothetical protein